MSRPRTIASKASSELLNLLKDKTVGARLPSEIQLASSLGISRGLLRTLLLATESSGLVSREARGRQLSRAVSDQDYHAINSAVAPNALLEECFLEMIHSGAIVPKEKFSEVQLSRAASVSTTSAREFLISLSKFGMVEKNSNGGWILHGFDRKFAIEISDFRTMVEMTSIRRVRQVGLFDAQLLEIDGLIARHLAFDLNQDSPLSGWVDLDVEVHSWLMSFLDNRFVADLTAGISIVSVMHFGKESLSVTRERIKIAAQEHLGILQNLRARHFDDAFDGVAKHMTTERDALLRAILGYHSRILTMHAEPSPV